MFPSLLMVMFKSVPNTRVINRYLFEDDILPGCTGLLTPETMPNSYRISTVKIEPNKCVYFPYLPGHSLLLGSDSNYTASIYHYSDDGPKFNRSFENPLFLNVFTLIQDDTPYTIVKINSTSDKPVYLDYALTYLNAYFLPVKSSMIISTKLNGKHEIPISNFSPKEFRNFAENPKELPGKVLNMVLLLHKKMRKFKFSTTVKYDEKINKFPLYTDIMWDKMFTEGGEPKEGAGEVKFSPETQGHGAGAKLYVPDGKGTFTVTYEEVKSSSAEEEEKKMHMPEFEVTVTKDKEVILLSEVEVKTKKDKPSDQPSEIQSGKGLGGGAIAGIVIAVIVVIGVIVAVLVWLLVFKKTDSTKTEEQEP